MLFVKTLTTGRTTEPIDSLEEEPSITNATGERTTGEDYLGNEDEMNALLSTAKPGADQIEVPEPRLYIPQRKRCKCGREATWQRGTIPTAFNALIVMCNGCFERILSQTLSDVGKWQRIWDDGLRRTRVIT